MNEKRGDLRSAFVLFLLVLVILASAIYAINESNETEEPEAIAVENITETEIVNETVAGVVNETTIINETAEINQTEINFESAIVTVTAKGNKLYKCKEWDFEMQQCEGEWTFFMSIIPGQEYSFTLTAEDPGFGEIIAIDAVHLDENYNFISNIYDDISARDNVWSEAIYQGELVRVTFEEDLKNGNMIDVYVRSNRTVAYFDVYEAGTQNKVGSSGIVEYPELIYIPIQNLENPTDTFDLKVIKVYPIPGDDSTNINPDAAPAAALLPPHIPASSMAAVDSAAVKNVAKVST